MKISNYVIVFFLSIAVFVVRIDTSIMFNNLVTAQKKQYNHAIDTAIDDTMNAIVESVGASGSSADIDLDLVAEKYFTSLYAGFGALDSPSLQETLRVYTPALCLAEEDGFRVLYHAIGKNGVAQQWSNKKYYTWDSATTEGYRSGFTVNFTFTDEVTIHVDGTSFVYKGKVSQLQSLYPVIDDFTGEVQEKGKILQEVLQHEVFTDADLFDRTRRATITNTLVQELNYCVNEHNRVAETYGIQFNFSLPQSFADTAARAVDDVSLLSIFEGYPITGTGDQTYSKFSVAGARLTKSSGYLQTSTDNMKYYHKVTCGLAEGANIKYDTKEKAAEGGCFPCPYCCP